MLFSEVSRCCFRPSIGSDNSCACVDSGIGHPSVRNTELLVPQSSVLHNYYELRKETQWTRVEERPFEYWVLELKAVNPEDLKRIIVDNKIFDVHSQLMQNVKPVVEAAKFMLIQVKLAGRPASSSALAIYQGNVGTAKSICVRADECAKLFELDKGNITNFIRFHKSRTARRGNGNSGPNWLINRAIPPNTKETLINFAPKLVFVPGSSVSFVQINVLNLCSCP
ncbi:hypothetical protein BKA69DRAFT_299543 [Paraphysoderma sedebokerense]|nr:hypothetical protein BKA69DRAFT_299543 [Paraphysoderma sedebokerense]